MSLAVILVLSAVLISITGSQISCPGGCECLTEEQAKEKFKSYAKCADALCGYERVSGASSIQKYCFIKVESCSVG